MPSDPLRPDPRSAKAETLPPDDSPRSIEDVMAEYIGRLENEEGPDPGQYLRDYPEFAEELQSFFRNHHWIAPHLRHPEQVSLVGKQVGPYEIEAEIARGGMGVVYRARQAGLKRPVALKLIGSGILAGAEERRRFRVEAEAAAQLQHPGIIQIHDIGTWEGHEYFSMTLVEGSTLQQRVCDVRRDDRQSASLVRDVACAVAFAHARDIVHRDLKPENILVDGDGRPMVADFGLAKWHREGTLITRTGQVLGTPHYMSPEQASGRGDVNHLSDVYSLGAILYALLTGQPPHAGASPAEVLRSVLQDEPVAPRQIRRDVPLDLERICLQALRHESGDRYPSAQAFADDLDRFLAGEPLRGITSGLVDRFARELRRDQHQDHFHPWGRTLVVLGLIIFAAHAAIQLLYLSGFDAWIGYWIPRIAMLAAMAGVIYRARGRSLMPRGVAERPVWSVWLGYLAALGVMNVLLFLGTIDEDALFPLAAVLSGFGFISMAGHVWGGAAPLGGLFLVLAMLMVAVPAISPLLFGLCWLFTLSVLGQHYGGTLVSSVEEYVPEEENVQQPEAGKSQRTT